MEFLFSGLYDAVPDIDLYLERIEYHGDRRPTLNNLKELIRKNLTHIPYSNLDFYQNQSCPSLDIKDIFEKVIIKHRGGGCFELNLLFFALLRALGYDYFIVIVKCLFGSGDPVVPTHCAAIVTIDGKQYYVDVGLGLPSPVVPVELNEHSDWQPASVLPYRYSYNMHKKGNTILLEGYNGDERLSMVSFALQPVEVVDLIPLHFYACKSETSPVTKRIIVEMFLERGTARIVKDELVISSEEKVKRRKIETDDDLHNVLLETFGISV